MQQKKLRHERSSTYIFVGAFVLVSIFVFAWLLVLQHHDSERYEIVAEFNSIENLNEAAMVKLRGFTIGQVERIQFRPQPPTGEAYFLVALGIDSQYSIGPGTIAEIRGSGLVGETFVNLDVSQAEKGELAPRSRIAGRDAPGMKQLISSITEMAHKLGGAGESMRRADLGYKLGRIGDNVQRIAADLGQVAGQTDSLLLVSQRVVGGLEPQIERVSAGVELSLEQLTQTLQRTDTLVVATSKDIQSSVRALRLVAERLDEVLQRIDTMALSKETEIDETLSNLHAASAAVRELSEHPWKLLTGQGKKGPEVKTEDNVEQD